MYTLYWAGVTLLLCFGASHTNCESFELTHTVFKPELKDQCEQDPVLNQVLFNKFSCSVAWQHLKRNASFPCTEVWYKNKRQDKIGLKGPMQRAVGQYCNGTESPTECFTCFNDAVDHIWYRHQCETVSNWEKVDQCVRTYENPDFQWSRDLILRGTQKVVTVDRNSYPYELCGDKLADLGSYDTFIIQFPLRVPRVRQEEEKEFNVMLSLFLNAFENNNPEGKTLSNQGFRCEDFLKGGYLSRYYHGVIKHVVIPADDVIVKAYKTMREDMCNLTPNPTECVTCYNEGDNKFMFYLNNSNTEIKSVEDDFTRIDEIYDKCHSKTHVPLEYKNMLWTPHSELDKLEISCGEVFDSELRGLKKTKTFCEKNKGNKGENSRQKFNGALAVLSFNLFSHFAYGSRHQKSGECPFVAYKHLFCMMKVGEWFSQRLGNKLTKSEEDDTLNAFTSMLFEGCHNAYQLLLKSHSEF